GVSSLSLGFSSFSSFSWERPVWTTIRARNNRSSFLPTGQQFFYSPELLFRMEGEHNLALSLRGGTDIDLGGQMVLDGIQSLGHKVRKLLLALPVLGGQLVVRVPEGLDQLFGLPHRKLLGNYFFIDRELVLFLFDIDQCPPVAHADEPVPHPGLYDRVELQKAKVIGDRGTFLSDPGAQGFLGALDLVDESLIGQGELNGIQVLPLYVFHQGHVQGFLVVGDADIGGNGLQSHHFGGPEPTFPGHQLEFVEIELADGYGLDDAEFPNGTCQFLQGPIVEVGARLKGVYLNGFDIQFHHIADDLVRIFVRNGLYIVLRIFQ